MKKFIKYSLLLAIGFGTVGCTDLEEVVHDGFIPEGGASGAAELQTILGNVAGIHNDWARLWGIGDMTADAIMGPTRGGDWDDNAALRQMHAHTWAPDHVWLRDYFNNAMTGVYNADLVIASNKTVGEAKFLKAFFYYEMIDKFGQVPYRDSYDDMTVDAKVYTSSEAFDVAVKLAEDALGSLPNATPGEPSTISKDAARMLLAKLYLNKAVFTADQRAETYTFDAADMSKVIGYVNDMTASLYTNNDKGLAYWMNFSPDNSSSNELIFSVKADRGDGGASDIGNPHYTWRAGMHYNMTPDGWNGPVIVGEYYDYFLQNSVAEGTDPRATYQTDDIIANNGNPVGIMRGQVHKPGGSEKVLDRKGNDLIFTKQAALVLADPVKIESAGFRPMKYIPDHADIWNPGNDPVVYRFGDAILMRAEAALRGGSGADAQADLDAVRARVGLGSISASLDNVYAERARELWGEGHRRTDMLRFGTFLNAKEYKASKSDVKNLLFPIPADALANPNITQNPGY